MYQNFFKIFQPMGEEIWTRENFKPLLPRNQKRYIKFYSFKMCVSISTYSQNIIFYILSGGPLWKIQKTFRNTCFLAFSLQQLEILGKRSYNKLFYVKFTIKKWAWKFWYWIYFWRYMRVNIRIKSQATD